MKYISQEQQVVQGEKSRPFVRHPKAVADNLENQIGSSRTEILS